MNVSLLCQLCDLLWWLLIGIIGYIVVLIDFGLCETDDGLVIEWCKVKNIIDLLFEVFDFLLYLMERLCHRL